jgi:hypothetical protein
LKKEHKYYHEDDAGQYSSFENSKYASDPTGLMDFHEEFDTIPEAKKYVIRHKLHYVGAVVLPGTCLGTWLLLRGQPHGYGESCLINGECRRLN